MVRFCLIRDIFIEIIVSYCWIGRDILCSGYEEIERVWSGIEIFEY